MTSTPTTGTTALSRHKKSTIALAAGIAAVLTSLVNVGVASASVALGTPLTQQLGPGAYLTFTILAAVVGAIGWAFVARRARNARRLLLVLALAVLLASFVALAVLAALTVAQTGWAPIVTLAIMHTATVGLSVGTYSVLLPVKRA